MKFGSKIFFNLIYSKHINSYMKLVKQFIILLSILPLFGLGQIKTTGTPNISNFYKSDYNAGTQNWGITQDQNGFMYFANNNGVLVFDGLNWDIIEVSRSSAVRSVCVDRNNRIYVGLFNDFGVLENDNTGKLSYKSLRYLIPSNINDINDIWKIYDTRYGIVFQTYNYLFILKDGKIKNIKPKKNFHFSFYVNNRLLLHEPGIGLFEYINGIMAKVPWAGTLKDKSIEAILEVDDNNLLIGTDRDGIYKYSQGNLEEWDSPANDFIKTNKLFCATKVLGNYFVFGTILNGIVISDNKGNIVQHIGRNQGLQNNTILSAFSDNNENLWLGLDNGIGYVEINSPMSFITDFEGLGTGYCCRIFKGKLYLGTNQGLFVKTFDSFQQNNEQFESVKNTAGQVWSLDVFDGQLICGHNLGTFKIEDNEAFRISNEEGAWGYIHLKNRPELLLGGNYTGLVLLKKGKSGWGFYKKIEGFNESSRFLQESGDGAIWISHGAKGIFKVTLSDNLDSVKNFKLYNSTKGLPSNENNILFKYKEKEYISTINGIYIYKNETDSFIRDSELNKLFNINGRIKTFESDSSGNIWFISNNESGVLRLNEDLTYTKITSPFKPLEGKYVNEFEFIYPFNNEHVFIGLDNGFAHYSSKFPKSYSNRFKAFITKVEFPYIDSTLNFNKIYSENEFEFPFNKNAIRFHYSAPFFENLQQLEFSYFLENYSEEWSAWTKDSYKDFTNLWEGDYVFKVKAKNIYENESEISSFKFRISPPWQRSTLAFYIYLVSFTLFAFFLFRFVLYRIKQSNKKQKIKHKQELKKKEEQFQHRALVSEKEIIKLRNDKLRAEKLHRDKELANQTMNVIHKNKLLIKISEELRLIKNSIDDASVGTKISILKNRISKETDNKKQNQIFETYFDEVHEDFFKRLKEKYPQLTPNDLRLCAYIKMNISTKEIATLLSISDRGVEISRYRLRKKINLSREINLSTFLVGI